VKRLSLLSGAKRDVIGWRFAACVTALCLLVAVLGLVTTPAAAHALHRPAREPSPCQRAFPQARSKTKGHTTDYNRQESVEMVVCWGFGRSSKDHFEVTAGMACALLAQAVGVRHETTGLFVDGACSGAELAAHPDLETSVGAACGFVADLLEVPSPLAGKLAGLACTAAPTVGHRLGAWAESRHERDIARDVIHKGRCIRYSRHFGSPWSAVKCARSDPGFTRLPGPPRRTQPPPAAAVSRFDVPAGSSAIATPTSDGSVLLVQDSRDWRTYDLKTGIPLQNVVDVDYACAAGVFRRSDGRDVVVGVDWVQTPAAGIMPASTAYFVVGTDARSGRQLWRTAIGDLNLCPYDLTGTDYPSLGVQAQQSPSGQSVLFPAQVRTGNYVLIDLRQGNVTKLTGDGSVMIGSTVAIGDDGTDPPSAELYEADSGQAAGTSSSSALITCAQENGGYGCPVFNTGQGYTYVVGLDSGIVATQGVSGPSAWTNPDGDSETELQNGSTVVISPEVAYPAFGETAYSLTDGHALWSLSSAEYCGATNGRVFVTDNGSLAVLDALSGQQQSYDPTQSSCPLVINGAIVEGVIVEGSSGTLTVVREP
jgi:hypothetical protein